MWNDALPRQGITNWQTFYPVGTANNFQTWMKPPGCSWVYIYAQCAGAGGGRPANGSITVGGGGGGGGGVTRVLIPAFAIPDRLYVRTGSGGLGATTANTNGADGLDTIVSLAPNTTLGNCIVFAQAARGGGANGVQGTGANAGFLTPALVGVSLFSSTAGVNGTSGAGTANGSGSTANSSATILLSTGGTGGGNGTGSGGAIQYGGFLQNIVGGISGQNGNNGLQGGAIMAPGSKYFPVRFTGGTGGGGGTLAAGVCGNGGHGGVGGGGGGGGGGTDASLLSGNGGNGGDGFTMIGAF